MAKQPQTRITKTQYVTRQAFAALYDVTHVAVYRYVFGLIGGEQQEAEDITAETYLKAWDARERFAGDQQKALSWLFTIAKRIVIDRWRKHKVRPNKISIDDIVLQAPDATPEDVATVLEQSQQLLTLLHRLSDEKREMVVLRYLLNWSINSIADHMNKKPNTVSVALRRIMADLREQWLANEEGLS